MKAIFLVAVIAVTLVVGASTAGAAKAPDLGKCLDTTGHGSFRLGKVTDNLGLTPEVDEAARDRIRSYQSVRGFEGLEGIGLTPEQIAEIMRRINVIVAANSWPIGWPCQPFKNRAKVIKEIRATLVYNGYRPAMTFYAPSPRQITVRAIRDGFDMFAVVVKTGPRKIFISTRPLTTHGGGDGGSVTIPVKFDA